MGHGGVGEVPLRPQAARDGRDGAAEHPGDERAEREGLEEASDDGARRRGGKRRGDLHRERTAAAVNRRHDPRGDRTAGDGWRKGALVPG